MLEKHGISPADLQHSAQQPPKSLASSSLSPVNESAPPQVEREVPILAAQAADMEMHSIMSAMNRLESSREFSEIQEISTLVRELIRSREKRMEAERSALYYRHDMELKNSPGEVERGLLAEKLRFRFSRNLIYFKLGFAALMFSSGVLLALNNFQDIGFFMLGGSVSLLTETSLAKHETE